MIAYAWTSKLLRDVAFTWRPRELSCWLKKWLFWGNFAWTRIRSSITLLFLNSSRDKFMLLWQNLVTDVCVGFRPPCWRRSGRAPAWRLHANLYKFENCCDLNLGEGLWVITFFPFPDSGLYLLNGFDFYFDLLLNGVTVKTSNWLSLEAYLCERKT